MSDGGEDLGLSLKWADLQVFETNGRGGGKHSRVVASDDLLLPPSPFEGFPRVTPNKGLVRAVPPDTPGIPPSTPWRGQGGYNTNEQCCSLIGAHEVPNGREFLKPGYCGFYCTLPIHDDEMHASHLRFGEEGVVQVIIVWGGE